jgi:glutamate-1-semialdehyde 2,1-aminomutase
LRLGLVERGVYFFPVPTKQCSISFAHTTEDIEVTLQKFEDVLHSRVGK